jgi:hypothetical protein
MKTGRREAGRGGGVQKCAGIMNPRGALSDPIRLNPTTFKKMKPQMHTDERRWDGSSIRVYPCSSVVDFPPDPSQSGSIRLDPTGSDYFCHTPGGVGRIPAVVRQADAPLPLRVNPTQSDPIRLLLSHLAPNMTNPQMHTDEHRWDGSSIPVNPCSSAANPPLNPAESGSIRLDPVRGKNHGMHGMHGWGRQDDPFRPETQDPKPDPTELGLMKFDSDCRSSMTEASECRVDPAAVLGL